MAFIRGDVTPNLLQRHSILLDFTNPDLVSRIKREMIHQISPEAVLSGKRRDRRFDERRKPLYRAIVVSFLRYKMHVTLESVYTMRLVCGYRIGCYCYEASFADM